MTTEQQHTINLLRQRRYSVRMLSEHASGVVRVRVQRRLGLGWLPLAIDPDGRYWLVTLDRVQRGRHKEDQ